MTIREELREKYQLAVAKDYEDRMKNGTSILEDARKFIEETIIPEFREMSDENPLMSYLFIRFTVFAGGVVGFNTSIKGLTILKDNPYAPEIIKKAEEIAYTYDITAKAHENDYGATYEFSLSLK